MQPWNDGELEGEPEEIESNKCKSGELIHLLQCDESTLASYVGMEERVEGEPRGKWAKN